MKEVSLQEEPDFQKNDRQTDMLLYSSRSHGGNNAQFLIRSKRTETLKGGSAHTAVCWFDLRLAQNTGLEFLQTINNASVLNDSVPADCLFKVAKRKLDDTEVEILFFF